MHLKIKLTVAMPGDSLLGGSSLSPSTEKKWFCYTATKLGTNTFFVATKNFAAATKRFADRTKHFAVVTKYFYPYFNK